jgi:hypothetical protein
MPGHTGGYKSGDSLSRLFAQEKFYYTVDAGWILS